MSDTRATLNFKMQIYKVECETLLLFFIPKKAILAEQNKMKHVNCFFF